MEWGRREEEGSDGTVRRETDRRDRRVGRGQDRTGGGGEELWGLWLVNLGDYQGFQTEWNRRVHDRV